MKNNLTLNAPRLPKGFKWRVDSYLIGGRVRHCPKKFDEFSKREFISKSNGAYHFIGDGNKVLICSIQVVD